MSFPLVKRSEWGARKPEHVTRMDATNASTIHWNGPEVPDRGHDKCAALVRGIQNYHMDGRGWSDIAYNFVVCKHGYCYEGRGFNARSGANGTTSSNKVSYAVMFLGGEKNSFPEEARSTIHQVVGWINRSTNAPNKAKGHRDWKSTACPGDEIYGWVRSGMPLAKRPSARPEPRNSQGDETLYIYKSAEEARPFVEKSYERIAGRKVESEQTRETWVYAVVVDPKNVFEFLTALENEARIRNENRLRALHAEIEGHSHKEAGVLTEEEILATVAKALQNG